MDPTVADAAFNSNSPFRNSTSNPPAPTPQAVLLESLIPGYAFLSPILSPLLSYLQIDLSLILGLLLLSTFAGPYLAYWIDLITTFFEGNFVTSAQIRSRDEMYDQLMAWMSSQAFSKKTRSFVAEMAYSSLFSELAGDGVNGGDGGGGDDETEGATAAAAVEGADIELDDDSQDWRYKTAPLQFTPAPGTHYFKYKNQWIRLQRQEHETRDWGMPKETILLTTISRNPSLLKNLLTEARNKYLAQDKSKTIVYRPAPRIPTDGGNSNQWMRCLARPSRPVDTVVLDEKQKSEFIEDVKEYLSPVTARWYARRGIPYRRGYLLHGPPGTGKSSLSFAVAGLFGLKIYVLSLASRTLTEDALAGLFSTLPKRCVVLLEDIDTAGLSRVPITTTTTTKNTTSSSSSEDESDSEEPPTAPPTAPVTTTPTTTSSEKPVPGGVSFSGLLNAIDGVASHEGRVLILTTNHPEKLDAALIRPGRVDMKICFKLADSKAIVGLFEKMFEDDDIDNHLHAPQSSLSTPSLPSSSSYSTDKSSTQVKTASALPGTEKTCNVPTQKKEGGKKDVRALAQKFGAIVTPEIFSPAEVQGYLLKHKRDPVRAVEEAEKWVKLMKNSSRKKGRRSKGSRS